MTTTTKRTQSGIIEELLLLFTFCIALAIKSVRNFQVIYTRNLHTNNNTAPHRAEPHSSVLCRAGPQCVASIAIANDSGKTVTGTIRTITRFIHNDLSTLKNKHELRNEKLPCWQNVL